MDLRQIQLLTASFYPERNKPHGLAVDYSGGALSGSLHYQKYLLGEHTNGCKLAVPGWDFFEEPFHDQLLAEQFPPVLWPLFSTAKERVPLVPLWQTLRALEVLKESVRFVHSLHREASSAISKPKCEEPPLTYPTPNLLSAKAMASSFFPRYTCVTISSLTSLKG